MSDFCIWRIKKVPEKGRIAFKCFLPNLESLLVRIKIIHESNLRINALLGVKQSEG